MHLKLIVAALLVSILLINQAEGWRRRRFRARRFVRRPVRRFVRRSVRRFVRRSVRRLKTHGRRVVRTIGRRIKTIGKQYIKSLVNPYGKWLKPFSTLRNLAKGAGRFVKSNAGYLVTLNQQIFGIVKQNKEYLKRIIKQGRCIPRRRVGDETIPKPMLDGPNQEYMSVEPELLIDAYNDNTAAYPEMAQDDWNEMVNDMQRIEEMVKDQGLKLADLAYLLDNDDIVEPEEVTEEDLPENDNELYDLELMDLDQE